MHIFYLTVSLGNIWNTDLLDTSKYPNFYIVDEDQSNADNYKKQYLEQLKILLDHPEFVKLASACFRGNLGLEELQKRYDFIQENGLNPIGMRVHILKEDFLEMVGNEDIVYFTIHDVKLSRFSK